MSSCSKNEAEKLQFARLLFCLSGSPFKWLSMARKQTLLQHWSTLEHFKFVLFSFPPSAWEWHVMQMLEITMRKQRGIFSGCIVSNRWYADKCDYSWLFRWMPRCTVTNRFGYIVSYMFDIPSITNDRSKFIALLLLKNSNSSVRSYVETPYWTMTGVYFPQQFSWRNFLL